MYLDFFFFGDHLIRLIIIAHVVSTGAQVLGKSHCFTLVLVHFLTMHSLIVVSAINLILNVLTITAISACLFIHSLLSFAFFEELRSWSIRLLFIKVRLGLLMMVMMTATTASLILLSRVRRTASRFIRVSLRLLWLSVVGLIGMILSS